jgi:hypothetical protein
LDLPRPRAGGRESKPRCKHAGDGQGDPGLVAPFPVTAARPAHHRDPDPQPLAKSLGRWASLYPCALVGPALEPILTGPMGRECPQLARTQNFKVSFPFSCFGVARTAARFAGEGAHCMSEDIKRQQTTNMQSRCCPTRALRRTAPRQVRKYRAVAVGLVLQAISAFIGRTSRPRRVLRMSMVRTCIQHAVGNRHQRGHQPRVQIPQNSSSDGCR